MKNWRYNFISIFIFLFGFIIIGCLLKIQVLNHPYWKALAQGQQKAFLPFETERGEIFFRDGTPLAINQDFYFVYASPKEIKKPEETAQILSLILNLDDKKILEKIKNDNFHQVIKKRLTEKEVSDLKNINLPGIYLGKEKGRYYPYNELASKVIGFVGGEGKGQYGIEGFYEKELKGEEIFQELEKGPFGYLINNLCSELKKGADIILSLDYNIQFIAEKILKETKESLGFEEGEIIVMDPYSGAILALANLPNFNPNDYKSVDLEIFKNSSIQKIFEPGSIFKPITMAAALEEKKITPQTTYFDEGSVKIGGHIIHNYNKKKWGERTMTEVLENSINTGAIFAEQQLGHQLFLKYIEKFGFFEATGVDLEGEIFSQNKELKKGYEANFATASFGQGIGVTSIQIMRAISSIANMGNLVKPYIVEKIIKNGIEKEIKPEIQKEKIISPKTINQLTAMMVSVVENGYGKSAKIPGYYIAGKTGTAQIPWSVLGVQKDGYSPMTIQTFVGFFPAFNPQYVILVKLTNSQSSSAGYSAAPLFKKMAQYIINYKKIPPDYE